MPPRSIAMSLATALSDSSTFLAITANVPTSQANRAPFQELYAHNQADFAQVLRPVVKRSFQPSRVDMLPLALRQAFDTMVTGRPGPVNLDIPYNVFQEEADVELPARSHTHGAHRPSASEADVARALDLLAQAMQQVRAPRREVADARGEAGWMQTQAQHVDRRLPQLRRHADEQARGGLVAGHELPVAIDGERGVGL